MSRERRKEWSYRRRGRIYINPEERYPDYYREDPHFAEYGRRGRYRYAGYRRDRELDREVGSREAGPREAGHGYEQRYREEYREGWVGGRGVNSSFDSGVGAGSASIESRDSGRIDSGGNFNNNIDNRESARMERSEIETERRPREDKKEVGVVEAVEKKAEKKEEQLVAQLNVNAGRSGTKLEPILSTQRDIETERGAEAAKDMKVEGANSLNGIKRPKNTSVGLVVVESGVKVEASKKNKEPADGERLNKAPEDISTARNPSAETQQRGDAPSFALDRKSAQVADVNERPEAKESEISKRSRKRKDEKEDRWENKDRTDRVNGGVVLSGGDMMSGGDTVVRGNAAESPENKEDEKEKGTTARINRQTRGSSKGKIEPLGLLSATRDKKSSERTILGGAGRSRKEEIKEKSGKALGTHRHTGSASSVSISSPISSAESGQIGYTGRGEKEERKKEREESEKQEGEVGLGVVSAVCSYVIAKHVIEKEEAERVRLLNQRLNRERPFDVEKEIRTWEKSAELAQMSLEGESVREAIVNAINRSAANEARVPDILPNSLTSYLYNTVIRKPREVHTQKNRIRLYKGEEEILRQGFLETGKDFKMMQKQFLPWRTQKEVVLMYYHKKSELKLKIWKDIQRDVRKITDADLKEFVQMSWKKEEEDVFEGMYPTTGKRWSEYVEILKNKTEGDVRAYYKYFKKFIVRGKEEKQKRKRGETPKKEARSAETWQIHERQMFSLLFPHIGKNWGVLANYIITKNASEIRNYHRVYYKNLSAGERILETHLKDIGKPEIHTEPLPAMKDPENSQAHTKHAGVLFPANK